MPDQPEVGKALDAAQGLVVSVFPVEDDPRAQLLHDARLARDAEFFGKVALDMRDRADHVFVHSSFPRAETAIIDTPLTVMCRKIEAHSVFVFS